MKTQIDDFEARLDERCECPGAHAGLIEVPDTNEQFDDQLTRIEAALTRMDRGAYGYCTSCGSAIRIERLEVDPAAARCLACAKPSAD